MKYIVLIIAALSLMACTRPDNAREVLTANGYTNIQMEGYGFFACDEKDSFADAFVANSPNGTRVKGVVCSGLFKGSTIRFN